jgi:hypothetical protein
MNGFRFRAEGDITGDDVMGTNMVQLIEIQIIDKLAFLSNCNSRCFELENKSLIFADGVKKSVRFKRL